jgi:chromosome segregation ATPase
MSAIMAINNVSMEEQIGMLTGVTEITRNASSASRGLVMVSSRLTQVLDDTSSTGKKLTAIYDDLDIKLKDENGQLRSHYDILGDLATKWDSLSENQQKYIALTSAGARQQQNFVALMENWNQVSNATITAYKSMGSAQRENEKVMDSIEKKVEILKSQFQQLIIGKGGLQEFAKTILNIGIAILKFANSDIGKAIVQIVAMESAIILVSKGLTTFSTKLIEHAGVLVADGLATKGWTDAQIKARVAEIGFTEAVKLNTAALIDNAIAFATSPIGIVAITLAAVAAITIANTKATEKYNKRLQTANETLNSFKETIKNTDGELKNLKGELDNTLDQIKRNNELKTTLTDPEDIKILEKETKELERQEETLKRQIVLKEKEASNARADAEKQARETLKTTTESKIKRTELVDSFSGAGTGEYVGVTVTPTKELELVIEKYKELENESKNLNNQLSQVDTKSEEYAKLSAQLDENATEMENVKNRGIEMSDIIENSAESLVSTNGATLQYKNSLYELTDGFYELIGIQEENSEEAEKTIEELEKEAEEAEELSKHVEQLAQSLGITATELEGLRDRFDDLTLDNFLSQLAEAKQEISDYSTVIDNLQEALETASKAQEEYNENGYLTLDTFKGLMSISAQYLTALINENGQLEINQTTLGNLVEKIKVAKIEELQAAETADILAYAQGDVAEMSSLAQTALDNAGLSAETAGQRAANGATGFWELSDAIQAANDAANGKKTIVRNKGIEAIHNAYKDLAVQISKVKVNTTRAGNAATSAGKKGSSAAKSAKDATKELNKELEETKKKYDTVIKWISKQYDKEIDKIKKAEKEALKAEEAKIKAKEKEKDNALDAIEKEIDALEKEKDARKKYWDDQIDALKKQNDAAKDALELQEKLDALERARNTRVKIYKEGQGFVYDVDQTAVAEAQKELDEYLSEKAYEDELARLEALRDAEMDNYEQRIDAMNEYKDNVQANYEAQIEALNAHKEQLQEQYEAEIEMYENYKQQFEDMVNAYEEEQNRLLAQQLTGIDFENKNWMTRLDNLQKFVNEYNKLQKQIGGDNTNVSADKSFSSGGGLPSGGDKNPSTSRYDDRGYKLNDITTRTANIPFSNPKQQFIPYSGKTNISSNGIIKKHANGISSIKQDELAIVGENPNKEIVIGSKINNGQLMSLDKGTGVVNAESSKTLANMLNQVGQFGSSGFGSGNGTLNNNINNDSLVVNGVTIQGSNIKDPETFVNGLLNLKAEALQRAYKHR